MCFAKWLIIVYIVPNLTCRKINQPKFESMGSLWQCGHFNYVFGIKLGQHQFKMMYETELRPLGWVYLALLALKVLTQCSNE